jgi:hypothetical protein
VAIFGNLSEFGFLEVIKMLGRKSGVLGLSQLRPYERVELHLQAGVMQALYVDGAPVLDAAVARSYLLEIAGKRAGEFEFGNSRHAVLNPLNIVVTDALLRHGAHAELLEAPREHLPDPKTRFNVAQTVTSEHLDAELKRLWPLIHPHLMRGSSAEDIAAHLRLDSAAVQLALHKLRTIGAIRPARRIQERPSAAPTPPTRPAQAAPASKPTLLSRLLGALLFARRGT